MLYCIPSKMVTIKTGLNFNKIVDMSFSKKFIFR